jgi:hypothetical protein
MVNEHWNWLSSIWREEDCDGNSLANIDAKRLGYVQVTIESTDINMERTKWPFKSSRKGSSRRLVDKSWQSLHQSAANSTITYSLRRALRRARPVVSANSFREAAI